MALHILLKPATMHAFYCCTLHIRCKADTEFKAKVHRFKKRYITVYNPYENYSNWSIMMTH